LESCAVVEQSQSKSEQMAEAFAAGSSYEAVAIAFGVHPNTVRRACKKHCVQRDERAERHERALRIAYDLDRGRTDEQLASELGISVERIGAIRARIRKAGAR
jgi:transposase-like protein